MHDDSPRIWNERYIVGGFVSLETDLELLILQNSMRSVHLHTMYPVIVLHVVELKQAEEMHLRAFLESLKPRSRHK